MNNLGHESTTRSQEITAQYFRFLDQHVADVIAGDVSEFMEINEIASALFVSHTHLTDTVQHETGNHPCHFYDLKIIEHAKRMLNETNWPVSRIANILTYDPSNFSKFFKKFVQQTPGQYRRSQAVLVFSGTEKKNKISEKFTTK